MPTEFIFNIDAGDSWSESIIPAVASGATITDASMEIRSASGYLLERLSPTMGNVDIVTNNNIQSLVLSLTQAQTLSLGAGLPGSSVVVGYAGNGLAFPYDLFMQTSLGGVTNWSKVYYGFVRVIPAITRMFT